MTTGCFNLKIYSVDVYPKIQNVVNTKTNSIFLIFCFKRKRICSSMPLTDLKESWFIIHQYEKLNQDKDDKFFTAFKKKWRIILQSSKITVIGRKDECLK